MAAIDFINTREQAQKFGLSDSGVKEIIRVIFWTQLWPIIKDMQLKADVKLFGFLPIRPSVRLRNLKPTFESIFGPAL